MRRPLKIAAAVSLVLAAIVPANATFPYPAGLPGGPYDYTKFKIQNGSCDKPWKPSQRVGAASDLPAGFNCDSQWKISDHVARPGDLNYDPSVANNPQEICRTTADAGVLCGVQGPGTNRAWEITTGRPDTIIAVLDSGIRWNKNEPSLFNKFYLNRGELPRPCASACAEVKGGTLQDYDINGDGAFNVKDYANDPRAYDLNDENTVLDPGDLIRLFSDGVDDDGNGYTDDISGWDFFEGDNNAEDDTDYGHGTGESKDSGAEIEVTNTQCPNCMLLEMRVGDSFVADVNAWAEATIYATDNGADVIQEALGTLNHTGYAQAAADYAYEMGVLIVASEADESAGHHNYPAALNHTMVVNSVTDPFAPALPPQSYLQFNGCTNFGGYTWVSVASTSCSSEATGASSGYAGLLYSAARNAIASGQMQQRQDIARPISAEEAKQLFRVAADDIDFSTPKPPFGPPNNFFTSLPASQRFVTTAGWDQISGWGRATSGRMIELVKPRDGSLAKIPPEGDIVSPRWWQPLGTSGTVNIVGRVAAPRATSYTYKLEFAPGVQPPRWPLSDTWTTFATGSGIAPIQGVLGVLDLAQVRTAMLTAPPPYTPADDPTSRDLPEKDAFRVRVVVSDDRADTADAIEQRQYFSVDDDALLAGFPKFLHADGAGSPAFDDIDGDGRDELVIADGNGFVHAFKADGTEAAGWPVHTVRLNLPTSGANAYGRGDVSPNVFAPVLLGSPTVADLDRDGTVEVSVADIEGNLYVWEHTGALRAGFPVRGNPAFSEEPGCQLGPPVAPTCDDYAPVDVRDRINTVDRAFTANPAAGDLDPSTPGLEIVAGSNDGHVYAWHADGTPVNGWPVLLRDPSKVAAVNPVSHKITHTANSNVRYERKILAGVSLGDVDGDGYLEVASNVNEEYVETPNWSERDPALSAIGRGASVLGVSPGNTRVYLLHHDGTAHPATAAQQATPHPDDQAYAPGWPVPIAMVTTELLPYVGAGSNGAPVLADVDGDGSLEIGTASMAGPAYLLKKDGSSFYGKLPDGRYITMASSVSEFKSSANDGPSMAALGGGVFGRMGGQASPVSFAIGAAGLRRLLDVILPEQQLGAEDHIDVWNALTGTFDPGFPAQVNDLMFFNSPAIADVSGDGLADVLQSTAMYDLRAYSAGGVPVLGWPKFTGGWSVSTPGTGDLDGDGKLDVALMSREGNLFVWKTAGRACQHAEWAKYQHDLWNSGAYGTDAKRPAPVTDLEAVSDGSKVLLTFTTSGDDGWCGRTHHYDIRVDGSLVASPEIWDSVANGPGVAYFDVSGLPGNVTIQAVDEAGNRGPIAGTTNIPYMEITRY